MKLSWLSKNDLVKYQYNGSFEAGEEQAINQISRFPQIMHFSKKCQARTLLLNFLV